MLNIFIVQNRLSARIFKNLRNIDYLLVGILLYAFAIFVFFFQKFYIFTALIVFVFLFFIQEVYKRKPNTLDIYYMLVFPFSRTSIINKYLFSDLFEIKSVTIVAYLILICLYNLRLIIFITILFIAFSFFLSLYNLLVKRYNTAYQTHRWTRTAIPLLIVFPFIDIFIGTENAEIYSRILRNIEGQIINHILGYTIAMALICLLIYFCVSNLIKRVILARPLVNDKILEKG
jgi:hypothetical protein